MKFRCTARRQMAIGWFIPCRPERMMSTKTVAIRRQGNIIGGFVQ